MGLFNAVTMVTGAEMGPDCVVTDGLRAADDDVFQTLNNICPETQNIFYINDFTTTILCFCIFADSVKCIHHFFIRQRFESDKIAQFYCG